MKGKVVIITGSSSGIGLSLAHEFGSRGASVVISGRNQERLDTAFKELQLKGVDTLAIKTDVSVETECENLINRTLE